MAMSATEAPVVRTKAGDLRGAYENGIAVFRGVPYAAAPIGDLRFSPPQPVPAWRAVRDAREDGPIAPVPTRPLASNASPKPTACCRARPTASPTMRPTTRSGRPRAAKSPNAGTGRPQYVQSA